MSSGNSNWLQLVGGYRMPLDPRPLVAQLEAATDTEAAWDEIWSELHHQGDVGDASYAAVPLLVEFHRKRGVVDWNTYAVVAVIELARTKGHNPPLPGWLSDDYFGALHSLARIGSEEILASQDADTTRAILSIIAIAKGLRTHAQFLIGYSEDELIEIESRL